MGDASALHILAKEGDTKTLSQALKSADANVVDGDGMRPLHYAAWYGHPGCIQALLSAGAEIDAHDYDGATALHAAAYNGQLNTALLLVEQGADATITDNNNETACEVAVEEGHELVAKFLKLAEEDHKADKVMQRMEKALAEAKEKAKAARSEYAKGHKEAKKTVAELEKEARKQAKKTLKAKKRKKSKGGDVPEAGPVEKGAAPTSFSQLAGMSGAPASTSSPARPQRRRTSSTDNGSTGTGMRDRGASRTSMTSAHSQSTDGGGDVRSRRSDTGMLLAQLGADKDDGEALRLFLATLDMQEFARVFEDEGMSLEDLQQCSAADLKKLGLPSGVRKKLTAALDSA
ncbi:hypothetical protein PTSG_09021 [Salpingoeca rosetta]|uniref:SAM domain-containing protein n=1 Tax=Salpingoeca rosetta (strain ATCC 50818 / BSB-021) TaxID=946362 RepID=F2ULZ6_SALR5|nr:uncharacterized protein PTSG_09021 [Salpingoeca rosetta]EGD78145.1 hypothetical protein PTSG_09021 [Salpingoeca rosetta]|eukprot:XP_004989821.1 hypothetical protein PTSG_09021 [Salpingoeca rosetta]